MHRGAGPVTVGGMGMTGTGTLRLVGTVLPGGERRELHLRGGLVVERPAGGEVSTLCTDGWIVPGLVDAHCHIGLDQRGAVDEETQLEQAIADRDAGALLVRDAGSAADTRWIDGREDLPKIIRAGRHIARSKRYIRNYGWEIEPEELVEYVEQEARRGDGWVKLVGDWIDRDAGDLTPCWPADALDAAIARAHELGARVTAHVFGEHALPDLLAAGIDCLEHATGLRPELLDDMAARGVAVVPTIIQLENFPQYADQAEAKFPQYAAHMRDLYERRHETLRNAVEAGVPVYAGTDAGGVLGHGLVADEIRALTEIGMTGEQALAAGSWAAREWLGVPGELTPGDPADLVVYDEDPRLDPRVLDAPRLIVLRGNPVKG
jgi:imidazolonepropionase-like amidohydrolase